MSTRTIQVPIRSGLLHLDENEGPVPAFDPTPIVERALLRRYPDTRELGERLARDHAVESSRVLISAGSDDAIDRLCRVVLGPGKSALIPAPTFDMIPRYINLAGAGTHAIPWLDGAFPRAAVLATAAVHSPALIAIVSPNNPTGLVASAADVIAISRAAPNAAILVDHAYAEYADADLTAIAMTLSNVIVTRTLSKAWGLAGLRVGYAIGVAPLVAAMRRAGPAYPVSGLSAAMAMAALDSMQPAMLDHVARVRFERSLLAQALRAIGAIVPESQANCVCARHPRATDLHAAFAAHSIRVRLLNSEAPLGPALRIGCPGNPADFDRLLAVIERIGREVH